MEKSLFLWDKLLQTSTFTNQLFFPFLLSSLPSAPPLSLPAAAELSVLSLGGCGVDDPAFWVLPEGLSAPASAEGSF